MALAADRRVQARRAAEPAGARPGNRHRRRADAIDTATELMAYYPVQVEKMLAQYDVLSSELGEARVRGLYDAEELEILDEYLAHGKAVRAERAPRESG